MDADDHRAGVGPQQSRRHMHGGALAGTVGAEQAEDLAGPDLERQVVDGDARAVALHDVGNDEHDCCMVRRRPFRGSTLLVRAP